MMKPSLITSLFAAVIASASLSGCAAYMSVLNAMPRVGGSFKAVNTTSTPICKVEVYSTSHPDAKYTNENKYKVLIAPGESKDLHFPDVNKDISTPDPTADTAKFALKAYGCKAGAAPNTVEPDFELASLDNVDVKGKNPTILR